METKQDSVDRKQIIEERNFRDFAEQKGINRYAFTNVEEKFDVNFSSGNTWCIGEIKVRKDMDIKFFDKYGPFLELIKIEGMYKKKIELEEMYEKEITMMYLNYAKDGLQIFYLNEPWTYNFSWKKLPKDNFEPHILVWKMVAELKNAQETIKNK